MKVNHLWGCYRIQFSSKRYILLEVLACSILRLVTYFDDPARRVKIQTMSKKNPAIPHTKTSNKLFIAQLLYFMGIFQKVGKATQIEK